MAESPEHLEAEKWPPPVLRRGDGTGLLCIHGSAATRTTFTLQVHDLCDEFAVVAYDRRIGRGLTAEGHAADAEEVIGRELGGAPALVLGSSLGGVIALELALRAPGLVRGMVLCEPPLPPGEWVPAAPVGFGCAYEDIAARASGEGAAEMFLRTVLGDEPFEAIPARYRIELCKSSWRQIQSDMYSHGSYRVAFERLSRVACPVLLLEGVRSPAFYRVGLDILERLLPRVERARIPNAGHSMHIDNSRRVNRLIRHFAERLPPPSSAPHRIPAPSPSSA